MDINTSFCGLELKSPVIVGSCSLTFNAQRNLEFEKAGAGAIVIKSIFEEEILSDSGQYDASMHSEGYDYLGFYQKYNHLDQYCNLIRETKSLCSIPVIASVCCLDSNEWVSYAKMFEDAGADAIELNVLAIESSLPYKYGSFEKENVKILESVRKKVTIPVIMKVGNNFTNVIPLAKDLSESGAAAMVLFNKMCPVDFDIESLSCKMGEFLSCNSAIYSALRWIALTNAKVPGLPLLASGGVLDGGGLVKVLLAGATGVEIASALYRGGTAAITGMNGFLREWMERHGFENLASFRGRLNAVAIQGGSEFERVQFHKNISKGNL